MAFSQPRLSDVIPGAMPLATVKGAFGQTSWQKPDEPLDGLLALGRCRMAAVPARPERHDHQRCHDHQRLLPSRTQLRQIRHGSTCWILLVGLRYFAKLTYVNQSTIVR